MSSPMDLTPWIPLADATTAWLLTYLLHSTLLLGAAWLVCRILGRRRLAAQETLWKIALVGGLATATLQAGIGWQPLAGSLHLGEAAATTVERSTVPLTGRAAALPLAATDEPAIGRVADGGEPAPAAALPRVEATASRSATDAAYPTLSWTALVSLLWLGGALLGIVLLALSYLALTRRLRGRGEVTGGGLRTIFARLLARAGLRRPVRLTASSRLPSPIARGVVDAEVCVPTRVLSDLSREQQESLLAHELAHVARRDPLWLLATRLLESVLFVQPLNRLARKRLQEIAEYRADDWAVGVTGEPLELARCLTRVADWNLTPLPVPAMGQERSGLGRRVHRLLARDARADSPSRLLAWAAAALLVVLAVVAPGVSASAPEAPEPPEAPEAPVAVEAPESPEPPEAPELGTPEVAEAPEAPSLAEPPESPASPAVPEAPEVPEAPVTPSEAPEIPVAPEAPEPASAPEGVEVALLAPAPDPRPAPGEPGPSVQIDDEGRVTRDEELEIEVEREIERVLEPELEALEASLEAAMAPLEELELHMEAFEEIFEEELEGHLEALEEGVERDLEPRLEALGELAARRELTPAEEAELARLQAELERRTAGVQRIVERFHRDFMEPFHGRLAREMETTIRPLVEQMQPSEEAMERLAREARRLARREQLSEAELAELRAQVRRLAAEARPSAEEQRRLAEEVRRLAEAARPSAEEMRRMREELRRALEELERERQQREP